MSTPSSRSPDTRVSPLFGGIACRDHSTGRAGRIIAKHCHVAGSSYVVLLLARKLPEPHCRRAQHWWIPRVLRSSLRETQRVENRWRGLVTATSLTTEALRGRTHLSPG